MILIKITVTLNLCINRYVSGFLNHDSMVSRIMKIRVIMAHSNQLTKLSPSILLKCFVFPVTK